MQVSKNQQGTLEWRKERLGKITGTRCKDLFGTPAKRKALVEELVAELLTNKPEENYVSTTMQRGIDEERFAKKEYTERTGLVLEDIGLCTHDTIKILALSPDGLTADYKHGVEVKCPDTKTHIKYILANQLPDEYKYQVAQYFTVNDKLETLDFISYDNRVELESLQMFIFRVNRADIAGLVEDIVHEAKQVEKEVKQIIDKLTF